MKFRLIILHLKDTLNLSLPIIASRAGAQVIFMINLAMIGQSDTQQLSSFALATAPNFTMNLMAIMLFSGFTIEVTKARALKSNSEIQKQWQAGFWSWLFLSITATILFSLASLLHSSSGTDSVTRQTMMVLACGSPAFIGYFFISGFLEALNKAKPASVATAIGLSINIVLNLILLSHNFIQHSAVAIATAMITVRWMIFFYLLRALSRELKAADISIKPGSPKQSLHTAYKQFVFGGPIALSAGLRSAVFSSLTIITTHLGHSAVAAFSVTTQLIGFSNMISNGIANATMVRIARYAKLQKLSSIRASFKASTLLSILFFFLISILMIMKTKMIFRLFSSDPEVIHLLLNGLAAILSIFAIDSASNIIIAGLRPLGDRWIPQAGSSLILITGSIPLAYFSIYTLNIGISGIFLGLFLSYLAAGCFVFYRYKFNPVFLKSEE